jgi:SPP1 family predicted phage head-tail adaptor
MAVVNRAGLMRDRVAIKQRVDGLDEYGGQSESFTTLATVWAQVKPATGTERHAADQPEAILSHTVTIRYRSDITPELYLEVENGPTLDIWSVNNIDRRNARLELSCLERRVSDGA